MFDFSCYIDILHIFFNLLEKFDQPISFNFD